MAATAANRNFHFWISFVILAMGSKKPVNCHHHRTEMAVFRLSFFIEQIPLFIPVTTSKRINNDAKVYLELDGVLKKKFFFVNSGVWRRLNVSKCTLVSARKLFCWSDQLYPPPPDQPNRTAQSLDRSTFANRPSVLRQNCKIKYENRIPPWKKRSSRDDLRSRYHAMFFLGLSITALERFPESLLWVSMGQSQISETKKKTKTIPSYFFCSLKNRPRVQKTIDTVHLG